MGQDRKEEESKDKEESRCPVECDVKGNRSRCSHRIGNDKDQDGSALSIKKNIYPLEKDK